MTTSVSGRGFEDVDATTDPCARVSYLDAVTALQGARGYKRQTYALMDIRPGAVVLDVGCGAGDDLRELAAIVGPSGRVVGIDASQTMVDQATARTHGLPVECRMGDAHQLDFPDQSFDACRSDRVFQHLERPERAFAELVRVAKPGAAIVLLEPDWDSLLIDATDKRLTRQIREVNCDRHRNGWMGRQLFGLAQRAGLTDVQVTGVSAVFTDWKDATLLGFLDAADEAVRLGLAAADEIATWIQDLENRAAGGVFFSALMAFMLSARKPLQ